MRMTTVRGGNFGGGRIVESVLSGRRVKFRAVSGNYVTRTCCFFHATDDTLRLPPSPLSVLINVRWIAIIFDPFGTDRWVHASVAPLLCHRVGG